MLSRRIGLRLSIPGRPITTGAITGRSSSRSWEQGRVRRTEPLVIRRWIGRVGPGWLTARQTEAWTFIPGLGIIVALTTMRPTCGATCRQGAATRKLASLIWLLLCFAADHARADCASGA